MGVGDRLGPGLKETVLGFQPREAGQGDVGVGATVRPPAMEPESLTWKHLNDIAVKGGRILPNSQQPRHRAQRLTGLSFHCGDTGSLSAQEPRSRKPRGMAKNKNNKSRKPRGMAKNKNKCLKRALFLQQKTIQYCKAIILQLETN